MQFINQLVTHEVYEESVKKYCPIGTPGLTADGRLWIRSKAAGALSGLKRAVINSNYAPGCTGHEDEDGFEGVLYAAAVVGQQYVDVADTTARAAGYYEGGTFIAYGATCFEEKTIVGNAKGNGSTHVRIYLDSPLKYAISTSIGITAYPSPYGAVKAAMSTLQEYEPFVGVPAIPVTSGYHFWLQVGGKVCITAHGGTWPGQAAHYRDVFFWMDGTIDPASVADPTSGYQRAGFLLASTVNAYGDLWINLQLAGL